MISSRSGGDCYTTLLDSNSGNFVMYLSFIDLDTKLVHKSYQELFRLKFESSLMSIFLKSGKPKSTTSFYNILVQFFCRTKIAL